MDLYNTTAGDLMSKKVVTVSLQDSLRTAGRKMMEHKVHCLMVLAPAANRGVGIITRKDLVLLLENDDGSVFDELRVEDAMTSPAVTLQEDLCIADGIRLMRMTGVRTVPILKGKEVVGILSFSDVLNWAL